MGVEYIELRLARRRRVKGVQLRSHLVSHGLRRGAGRERRTLKSVRRVEIAAQAHEERGVIHQIDAVDPHVEQLLVGRVTERALNPVEIPMRRVLGAFGEELKVARPLTRVEAPTCCKSFAQVWFERLETVVHPRRPPAATTVLKLDKLLNLGISFCEEARHVQLLIALWNRPRWRGWSIAKECRPTEDF